MIEFVDAVEFFAALIRKFEQGRLQPNTSALEEMVLKTCKTELAYIDNRKTALEKSHVDFWKREKELAKSAPGVLEPPFSEAIPKRLLYSKSEQFPDFLFKTREFRSKLFCGSILELKDSKGGSIASFNSTLPSKSKSLTEIEIINGNNLVSKIASIKDADLSKHKNYYSFSRRNFYLIRTSKENEDKVKISLVEGSFFETVPKDQLIYQMFLNLLQDHLKKKKIKYSTERLEMIQQALAQISDQTIIAASQNIEKASIRPRFRLMAEVHSEGNPHSSHYPEIGERTLNLIVQKSDHDEKIAEITKKTNSSIKVFAIKHIRNGWHTVFQYKF